MKEELGSSEGRLEWEMFGCRNVEHVCVRGKEAKRERNIRPIGGQKKRFGESCTFNGKLRKLQEFCLFHRVESSLITVRVAWGFKNSYMRKVAPR